MVRSIQRGVSMDWVVITDRDAGPQPNPVEVFADHADGYVVSGKVQTDSETFVHVQEV